MNGPVNIGRYKLIEELGRGGMGVVYLGEDPILERRVAIKVLPPKKLSQKTVDRFLREAKTAARLDSPFIVKIHDIGKTPDDLHYIVMEYVEGNTLGDMIEFEQVPDEDTLNKLLAVFRQVLEAVAYAHDNGVIHRDLKPDNIMLNKAGQVKVMDFGLAFFEGKHSLTEVGQVMGTAAYVSPEQAVGGLTDHRADIYSLGVILFEILTGRWPFSATNPLEMFRKVAEEPAPSPRAFNISLPAALEKITLKALRKKPEERYSSTREMLDEFNAFLNNNRSLGASAEASAVNNPAVKSSAAPAANALSSLSGASVLDELLQSGMNLSRSYSAPVPAFKPTAPAPTSHNVYVPPAQPVVPVAVPKAAARPAIPSPGPVLRHDIEQTVVDGLGSVPDLHSSRRSSSGSLLQTVPAQGAGGRSATAPSASVENKVSIPVPETPAPDAPRAKSTAFKPTSGAGVVASGSWMANVQETPPSNNLEQVMQRLSRTEAESVSSRPVEGSQLCPDCGAENPASAKMCRSCSAPLRSVHYVIQREAGGFVDSGRSLFQQGLFNEAIVDLKQAVGKDHSYAEAFYWLGRAYLEVGDYPQARSNLEKAVELNPQDVSQYLALASYYRQADQPEMVISSLHSVLEHEPDNIAVRLRLAFLYAEMGSAEASVAQYKGVLELEPDCQEANRQLGYVLAWEDRLGEALPFLERACNLDGRDIDALRLLADLYNKGGVVNNAVQIVRSGLAVDPLNPDLHTDLARLLFSLNEDQDAAQELATALECEPGHSEASVQLAAVFYRHNQLREAENCLSQALRFHPNSLLLHRRVGEFYLYAGNLEKALSHVKRVIEVDPACIEMLKKIGHLVLRKSYDPKDLDSYRQAVEAHPVNPAYREDLAMAYYAAGNLAEAVRELYKALRLDYRNADYPKALGLMLIEAGEYNDAVRELNSSLDVRPNDPQVHAMLGQALMKLGMSNLALEQLVRALELDRSLYILNMPLAEAYMHLGRNNRAIECLEQLLQKVNDHQDSARMGEVFVHMGNAYLNSHDDERSAELFSAALKRNTDCAGAWHGLARVALEKKKFAQAQAWLDKAVKAEPFNVDFMITAADIQGDQNRWAQAVSILQDAVKKAPDKPRVYEQLGRALRKGGRFQDAIEVFKVASSRFPDYSGHFLWLCGRTEFRQGQVEAAVWSYRQALEIVGSDWRIFQDLGRACQSLGQREEAVQAYQQALQCAPPEEYKQIKSLLKHV